MRSSRSPRARYSRVKHHDKEYGYRGPTVLSPRAPPVALGIPPRAMTPCWRPLGADWQGTAPLKLSPLQALHKRRRDSCLFHPHVSKNMLQSIDHPTRIKANETEARQFLNSGNEPIARLLPNLNHLKLDQDQICRHLAKVRNFPFVMQQLKVRRLHEKLTSGQSCRNLVDPSAKAWGVASPRFVRTHGPLELSNLTYRCTRPSKFDSEVDSFYVS